MTDQSTFETWAIVELFGHNQIAGYLSEQVIGGASFVRVDVPEVDGKPGFTKLFGGAAIYAITPTTEEIATEAARRLDVRPVGLWVVPDPKPQLPAVTYGQDGFLEDDDYDYEDEPEPEF